MKLNETLYAIMNKEETVNEIRETPTGADLALNSWRGGATAFMDYRVVRVKLVEVEEDEK